MHIAASGLPGPERAGSRVQKGFKLAGIGLKPAPSAVPLCDARPPTNTTAGARACEAENSGARAPNAVLASALRCRLLSAPPSGQKPFFFLAYVSVAL